VTIAPSARVRTSILAITAACGMAGGTVAYATGLSQTTAHTAPHASGAAHGRGAAISAIAHDASLVGAAKVAAVSAAADAATAASGSHPAAKSSGKGASISLLATTTTATGVAKGALISTAASGGTSRAGQHGGGSTNGATASAAGRARAAGAQDGHSAGGSGTTAR
jgi:hypothetical protein